MITKQLLVDTGFDRVQGSSVWHHSGADVYVKYIEILIQGEVTVLDGKTDSDEKMLKAVEDGLEKYGDVAVEDSVEETVVTPVVEDLVEENTIEENIVTQPVD